MNPKNHKTSREFFIFYTIHVIVVMSIEQWLTVYFESVSDVSAFFSDISPVSRLIRNKDLALPLPTISYSILLSGNYKRRLEFSILK